MNTIVVEKAAPGTRARRYLCRYAIVLAVAAMATSVCAAPAWPESSFTYISDSQPLPEVLGRFGRTFGLETRLTSMVAGSTATVNGKITTASPTEFMNQVSSAYGLTWFAQNGTLYVSRSSERTISSLMPPGISAAGLRKALTELGVLDPKFGWGEVPERGIVLVSGPPAYVDLVLRAVRELPAMPPDQELQVFRLRHAPVDDRNIFYRDKQIVTPGVATILRGLISGESRSGTSIILSEMAAPLRGTLAPLPTTDGEGGRQRTDGAAVTVPPGSPVQTRGVIQADPRLNAIIIKDRPENMQIYRQMITLLDVPSQLVEIEAMILDVNASQIAQLGIDWSARAGRVSGNIGNPAVSNGNASALISLGSASSATIISDAANFLLTRVNALESRGQAKVVSRPSILTIDNQGALIDLAETFYIESLGERVANVTPVSVGVTLRVTPHIIEEDGRRSVQLVVDIEDGSRTDQTVKGLPVIRRSNIGTQAVINEHDSLLIGGFNSETTIKNKETVPLLSEMPLVGPLFGTTRSTVERRQRLFLITPRIISSAASGQPLGTGPVSLTSSSTASNSVRTNAPAVPIPWPVTEKNEGTNEQSRENALKIRMDTQIKVVPALQRGGNTN